MAIPLRFFSRVLLGIFLSAPGVAQSPASALPQTQLPALPKQPAKIFAAAGPLYDFAAPTLKPWHMKVSYQLYDEKAQPSSAGTFEYWWAAPDTYRTTWLRSGMEQTDWLVKGEHFDRISGDQLGSDEEGLQSELLQPLPPPEILEKAKLKRDEQKLGDLTLPCVKVMPSTGDFPEYCFEPGHPILRMESYPSGRKIYSSVTLTQRRFLGREIQVVANDRLVLTARVELVETILPQTSELSPEDGVTRSSRGIHMAPGVTPPKITNSVHAVFPSSERARRGSGVVELVMTIGTDGRVHNPRVVSGTSKDFIDEALRAVSQYRFRPGLLLGNPVAVEVRFLINFKMQ